MYTAEWKRFKKLPIWERLRGYDVNVWAFVRNSKTVAGGKKLEIAQTGKISNSRGSSRGLKAGAWEAEPTKLGKQNAELSGRWLGSPEVFPLWKDSFHICLRI